MSSHKDHETKSLQMHRIVVERYGDDPEGTVRFGLDNLIRWKSNGVWCADYERWESILRHRPESLPEVLGGMDEDSVRLRQSSPFAGLLTQKQRNQILSVTA